MMRTPTTLGRHDSDRGYLQHGAGTLGPFRTESVPIRPRGYPHAGEWEARFEGRWRVVHVSVRRTWIVYRGAQIQILIQGV